MAVINCNATDRYDKIKYVLAHSSSGLLFSDIFARKPIVAIALSHLYRNNVINVMLDNIMRNTGVHLPDNLADLTKIFSSAK